MKKFPLLLIVIFSVYYARAYNPQDCRDAIPVCETVYHTDSSYKGAGDIEDEINKDFSCLNDGEKNSVWYVVNVKSSGKLGFLLTPNRATDDYDWAVYNLTNADCEDIKNPDSSHLEVSCNFYQVKLTNDYEGKTGPNGLSSETHQTHAEGSTPYNALIQVQEGEIYVIIISNYETAADMGYTIDFGISTASIFDDVAPYMLSAASPTGGGSNFEVLFSENVSCATVDAGDFSLSGPGGPYTVTSVYSENCNSGGEYDREYVLTVTPPITETGDYTLTINSEISDACENSVALGDNIVFYVDKISILLSADRLEVCEGDSVQLNVTHNGTAPFTYDWDHPELLSCSDCKNPMAYIDGTTTFHLTLTDANDNSNEAEITITANPRPELFAETKYVWVCEGFPAQLEVTSDQEGLNYIWVPAEGLSEITIPDPVFIGDKTTTYTVTATNPETGCSTDTEIYVEIVEAPKPEITVDGSPDDIAICENIEIRLDAGDTDVKLNQEIESWLWYKDGVMIENETGRYLDIDSEGSYIVKILAGTECSGWDTINVTTHPEVIVQINSPKTVCIGEEYILETEIVQCSGDAEFFWFYTKDFLDSDDTPSPHYSPTEEGTYDYIVQMTDKATGCMAYDTITVDVAPELIVDLGDDVDYCPGVDLIIQADVSGGTGNMTYTWEPSTGISFPDQNDKSRIKAGPDNTTTYKLTVSDENGCIGTDEITINVSSPYLELTIPELNEDPRTMGLRIPVKIEREDAYIACKPYGLALFFSWDMELFNPQSFIIKGTEKDLNKQLNDGKWVFNISLTSEQISAEGENLLEISGDVILGSVESIELGIDSIEWDGVTPELKINSGSLTLKNICKNNGLRLLKQKEGAIIHSVYPNPSYGNIEVNVSTNSGQDRGNIKITDMLGKEVFQTVVALEKNIDDNSESKTEIVISLTGIKSGIYEMIFSDGTSTDAKQIIIVN